MLPLVRPAAFKVARVTSLVPFLDLSSDGADVLTSTAVAMSSLFLRGGAESKVLDLTRVRIRLEGLHSYGVVTALLMNACLRMFSSTPKRLQPDGDLFTNIVKIIFALVVCVSVTTGSYTTIIFSMLGLYSKTALGMGCDDKFLRFFQATQPLRDSGFHAFIVSLFTFKMAFSLSMFLNYEGRFGWVIGVFSIVASLGFWTKWNECMKIAGEILFS
jgi:hypothetical protein